MTDQEFLSWVHDRMTAVYGEDPAVDYMSKLRSIINATPADQVTPNVGGVLYCVAGSVAGSGTAAAASSD